MKLERLLERQAKIALNQHSTFMTDTSAWGEKSLEPVSVGRHTVCACLVTKVIQNVVTNEGILLRSPLSSFSCCHFKLSCLAMQVLVFSFKLRDLCLITKMGKTIFYT